MLSGFYRVTFRLSETFVIFCSRPKFYHHVGNCTMYYCNTGWFA